MPAGEPPLRHNSHLLLAQSGGGIERDRCSRGDGMAVGLLDGIPRDEAEPAVEAPDTLAGPAAFAAAIARRLRLLYL